MPAKKLPTNKTESFDLEEIRALREEVEALRRGVAGLNGRLDIIETFLKLDVATWQPTEAQKEFADRMGIKLPGKN